MDKRNHMQLITTCIWIQMDKQHHIQLININCIWYNMIYKAALIPARSISGLGQVLGISKITNDWRWVPQTLILPGRPYRSLLPIVIVGTGYMLHFVTECKLQCVLLVLQMARQLAWQEFFRLYQSSKDRALVVQRTSSFASSGCRSQEILTILVPWCELIFVQTYSSILTSF